MNYEELYRKGLVLLQQHSLLAFEADQLFAKALSKRRHDLPHIRKETAPPEGAEEYLALCRRRAAGEPLQYLLGEWDFYGLTLSVGPGVLIPRADTEILVETALRLLKGSKNPQVLDLCSGSGCVAIALAQQCPEATVTALELSSQAMPYLLQNAKRYGGVQVVQSDLREYVHPNPLQLITCNPPYIPSKEIDGLQPELAFEPRLALDGGEDGLDFYHCIACGYYNQLKPGGFLCLEVGIHQAEPVAAMLLGEGFAEVGYEWDIGGIRRVVWGQR